MAIIKEWRCAAHGAFESISNCCEHCGHDRFVTREIRTAPAYRRRNMSMIDSTLRGIADDYGLTDLKNDPKAGVSVLQALKKTDDINKPRWGNVEHAAPGFSRNPDVKVPTVTAESMGFTPTPAADMKFPQPKTQIVGRYKGD